MLYRQAAGIRISINCALLVADLFCFVLFVCLFVFCYEKDFMVTLGLNFILVATNTKI